MTKKMWTNIWFICILIMYGAGTMYTGIVLTEEKITAQYFVNGTEKYLNGLKLDIPEEISISNSYDNNIKDLLSVDRDGYTLHLNFSGKSLLKNGNTDMVIDPLNDHSELPKK